MREKLKKEVNLTGFFTLAFGAMIGVGWVTAMGQWLTDAGPLGSMIAFAVGGAVMILVGLCYAEVTPMIPVSGGEVAYAYKSFGVGVSFIVGWYLAFGYLSVSAFEALSISKVVGYLLPGIEWLPLYEVNGSMVHGSELLIAIVSTLFILYVNLRGAGTAAKLQIIVTFSFLAFCVAFMAAGFISGSWANMEPLFAEVEKRSTLEGVFAVMITVPFWFVGFDTIPQSAEEAGEGVPPRKLGVLLVGSILAASAFYIVLIWSVGFVQPWGETVKGDLATASAFKAAFAQYPVFGNLVLLAALAGLITSWNGFFLAGSRVLFAMGRGRIISSKFAAVHPEYGTPKYAIYFAGFVTIAGAFMGNKALSTIIEVGSVCIIVAFLGVSVSFVSLRQKFPDAHRPYKSPLGLSTGIIAGVASLGMLYVALRPFDSNAGLSSSAEWYTLAGLTALGALVYFAGVKSRDSVTKKERDYLVLNEGEEPEES